MNRARRFVLALALAFASGTCNFDQGLADYCHVSKACACDGGVCCVTPQGACDDKNPCCGAMACINGYCFLPTDADAGPSDAGGTDAGDAGSACSANQASCGSSGACCSGACSDAGACCAPQGAACGSFTDCCDPLATCDGRCHGPPPPDGGSDAGADGG